MLPSEGPAALTWEVRGGGAEEGQRSSQKMEPSREPFRTVTHALNTALLQTRLDELVGLCLPSHRGPCAAVCPPHKAQKGHSGHEIIAGA